MLLNRDNPYYHQLVLLVAILPLVEEEDCFALKGGTAINLFFQDMPRLSVDIDLTYLPIEDRDTSLDAIRNALNRIAARVEKVLKGTSVEVLKDAQENVLKLMIDRQGVRVKVEVSPVLRGSLLAAPPVTMDFPVTL
ncbi:Ync [hydrothermal vent metagenome]|uniref:Ync n=1 Tax=hydrothermal vent metagenome TaxID=652676 RepID=A0A3B1ASR4_9ZZZZ